MSIRFIETMDAAQKQHAHAMMEQLAESLSGWAAGYPALRVAPRVPGIALMTAACVPLSPAEAQLTARLIAWIFAVDDALDERQLSLPAAGEAMARWRAMARGDAAEGDGADELTAMFAEICAELTAYPLFEQLRTFWIQSLDQLLSVALTEYSWAIDGVVPTLDEYLTIAKYSIAMYFWGASTMIVSGDESIPAHLDGITGLLGDAALAIRIYNDLRSYEREQQEGVVNAVALMCRSLTQQGHAESAALAHARRQLGHMADAAVQTVLEGTRSPRTATGFIEIVLARLVEFHAYYYGGSRHDYHITTRADAADMLSS